LSLIAIILAARHAALRAPALPTATVATGTPGGIWTMDNRASTPAKGPAATGTPMTGWPVIEATTPGKWAAIPATAT